MKKFFLLIAIAGGLLSTDAKNLRAVFSFARFNSSGNSPYLETYLSVSGQSVTFVKNAAGKFQAAIQINISITDEKGTVKHHDNYNLLSPSIDDTSKTDFSFLDQQRIALENGKYAMVITITDKNGGGKEFKIAQEVLMDFNPSIISLSDIVLVDNFTKTETENKLSKCGYDLIPYVDNVYPRSMKSFKFYAEIYHANSILGDSPYLLSYYIESVESHAKLNDYSVSKKQLPQEVTPLLSEFEIENLPNGQYNLVIELKDRENKLLAFNSTLFERQSFTKAKPNSLNLTGVNIENSWVMQFTNTDSLREYVACLRPISNAKELTWQDTQLKLAEKKLMQQFIYDFWQRRNAANPQEEWLKYKKQVDYVQGIYGTRLNKGYATDRGRVYLQYGAPNTITENDHEPDAYPYEIWHYYKIANQTNKRYIFYNPDLLEEDYRLLSSDMLGEINDPSWQMKLYKRNTQTPNLDVEKRQQNYGNHVDDLYNHPK